MLDSTSAGLALSFLLVCLVLAIYAKTLKSNLLSHWIILYFRSLRLTSISIFMHYLYKPLFLVKFSCLTNYLGNFSSIGTHYLPLLFNKISSRNYQTIFFLQQTVFLPLEGSFTVQSKYSMCAKIFFARQYKILSLASGYTRYLSHLFWGVLNSLVATRQQVASFFL